MTAPEELSDRQRELLKLIADGVSSAEIAERLDPEECAALRIVCATPGRKGIKPRPALERVLDRLLVGEPDECWMYRGAGDGKGYPVFNNQRVSRVILGLPRGDGVVARHKCDNPPCVNPAHLVAGSYWQNMADMRERGRMARGEEREHAKLDSEKIHAIRADERSCNEIARDYGTSADLIVQIKRGRAWKHVPIEGPVVLPTRHRYPDPSPRQMDILRLLHRGRSYDEICTELVVTLGTARCQMQRLYRKLGVHDRQSAVAVGIQRGYLSSDRDDSAVES